MFSFRSHGHGRRLGRLREYDKPERPVRIWTLRIGGIFSGTVARDGSYWTAPLNSTGLGGYPAALLATAFGLGAVRSSKWHALHRFFTLQIAREYDGPRSLVECVGPVTPGAYKGVGEWKLYPGIENHRTPLPDHLHDVFATWSRSFAILPSDFTLLYERFEILASLAVIGQQMDLQALQKAKSESQPHMAFVFAPVGMFSRRWTDFNLLVQELNSPELRDAILNVGFARGSPDFLQLYLEAAGRMAGGMRF